MTVRIVIVKVFMFRLGGIVKDYNIIDLLILALNDLNRNLLEGEGGDAFFEEL